MSSVPSRLSRSGSLSSAVLELYTYTYEPIVEAWTRSHGESLLKISTSLQLLVGFRELSVPRSVLARLAIETMREPGELEHLERQDVDQRLTALAVLLERSLARRLATTPEQRAAEEAAESPAVLARKKSDAALDAAMRRIVRKERLDSQSLTSIATNLAARRSSAVAPGRALLLARRESASGPEIAAAAVLAISKRDMEAAAAAERALRYGPAAPAKLPPNIDALLAEARRVWLPTTLVDVLLSRAAALQLTGASRLHSAGLCALLALVRAAKGDGLALLACTRIAPLLAAALRRATGQALLVALELCTTLLVLEVEQVRAPPRAVRTEEAQGGGEARAPAGQQPPGVRAQLRTAPGLEARLRAVADTLDPRTSYGRPFALGAKRVLALLGLRLRPVTRELVEAAEGAHGPAAALGHAVPGSVEAVQAAAMAERIAQASAAELAAMVDAANAVRRRWREYSQSGLVGDRSRRRLRALRESAALLLQATQRGRVRKLAYARMRDAATVIAACARGLLDRKLVRQACVQAMLTREEQDGGTYGGRAGSGHRQPRPSRSALAADALSEGSSSPMRRTPAPSPRAQRAVRPTSATPKITGMYGRIGARLFLVALDAERAKRTHRWALRSKATTKLQALFRGRAARRLAAELRAEVVRREEAVLAMIRARREMRAAATLLRHARRYLAAARRRQAEAARMAIAAAVRDREHRFAIARLGSLAPPNCAAEFGALPRKRPPAPWAAASDDANSWALNPEGAKPQRARDEARGPREAQGTRARHARPASASASSRSGREMAARQATAAAHAAPRAARAAAAAWQREAAPRRGTPKRTPAPACAARPTSASSRVPPSAAQPPAAADEGAKSELVVPRAESEASFYKAYAAARQAHAAVVADLVDSDVRRIALWVEPWRGELRLPHAQMAATLRGAMLDERAGEGAEHMLLDEILAQQAEDAGVTPGASDADAPAEETPAAADVGAPPRSPRSRAMAGLTQQLRRSVQRRDQAVSEGVANAPRSLRRALATAQMHSLAMLHAAPRAPRLPPAAEPPPSATAVFAAPRMPRMVALLPGKRPMSAPPSQPRARPQTQPQPQSQSQRHEKAPAAIRPATRAPSPTQPRTESAERAVDLRAARPHTATQSGPEEIGTSTSPLKSALASQRPKLRAPAPIDVPDGAAHALMVHWDPPSPAPTVPTPLLRRTSSGSLLPAFVESGALRRSILASSEQRFRKLSPAPTRGGEAEALDGSLRLISQEQRMIEQGRMDSAMKKHLRLLRRPAVAPQRGYMTAQLSSTRPGLTPGEEEEEEDTDLVAGSLTAGNVTDS